MKTKKLGNSDLELTVVGLGAWAIGGPWRYGWGEQDDQESIAAIQSSLDHGINWIDTAHAYGFGHSEEMVGKALKGRQDDVILATKCSILNDGSGNPVHSLKKDSVKKECEGSLKRMNVEKIDLYQIHWPNPEDEIEEGWEAISELIAEGKVRYGGVSNFDVEQMKRVGEIAPITSLQPPYNMFRRGIEEAIMPYCHENNIGIVAYSPMASGLLTGKVTTDYVKSQIADDDWRKNNPEFKEPRLSANVHFVETVLRPIADEHGVQPGQIAVAWTLADNKITSAIVGARRPSQVEHNVKAAEVELTPGQMQKIEDGLSERASKIG